MLKVSALAISLLMTAVTASHAACPAPAEYSGAAAIAANQQRVICLQREVDAAAQQRRVESQLNTLENRLDQMTVQRRFDNLPKIGQQWVP